MEDDSILKIKVQWGDGKLTYISVDVVKYIWADFSILGQNVQPSGDVVVSIVYQPPSITSVTYVVKNEDSSVAVVITVKTASEATIGKRFGLPVLAP